MSDRFVSAIGLALQVVCRTIRIRTVDENRFEDVRGARILCLWHGRTLPAIAHYRHTGMVVMISLSRDGEMLNRIFGGLGFDVVRGSSGPSGARALAQCIRALRGGASMAITPDGPRGPSGVVQEGVIMMARRSGCSLVPVGSSAKPRALTKAWDQFMLPAPFARAVLVYGEPIRVPADSSAEALEEIRRTLQAEMRRVQDEADRLLGQGTFGEVRAARAS